MNWLFVSAVALALLSIPATAQGLPLSRRLVLPGRTGLVERHRPETDCHAEDFPEDKYDFNPVTVQRSFADQLLHVAGSNDLFAQVTRGQKPVDDESRAHYPAKAAVVAYLKKSFGEGAAVIQAKGDRGMTETEKDAESGMTLLLTDLAYEIIEHSGEFYGQLLVYYRIAGLVSPESRPKK